MAITITEALAELKTIDKRLSKKKEYVGRNLFRLEQMKDPLANDGGSVEVVKRELQAIKDLEERKVAIRRAIRKANDDTTITVGTQSRSMADWLAWRRDVLPSRKEYFRILTSTIEAQRRQGVNKNSKVVSPGEEAKPNDVLIHLSETDLARWVEELEEIEGALDGQLSLKNATVVIEVG
ncbi:MAG TPA: hypothetical protein VFK94_06340 [Patescibacteria group bacterium]|nr:hypothetical protein [Patescibacteria group bacterium]